MTDDNYSVIMLSDKKASRDDGEIKKVMLGI